MKPTLVSKLEPMLQGPELAPPGELPAMSTEIYLAARPSGMLTPATDFATRHVAVPASADLDADAALVRVLCVSVDPAMRGWMSAARSYIRPVGVGERMRASGVGEVVASTGALSVGDLVYVGLG